MMNGKTLKSVFLMIVVTLCVILMAMTYLVIMKVIPLDIYKDILTTLGIPTLFGVITQAFINADFNKDGIPDSKQ